MKIVLGTAQFGMNYGILGNKKINDKEIKKIEKFTTKKKIRFIDTAFIYGESHNVISKSRLNKLNIVTKIKIPPNTKNIKSFTNEIILDFLKKLNTKKIYGILVHDLKDLKGTRGQIFLNSLKKIKEKKLVKYIGVSIYDPNELNVIWKTWVPDIVNVPFNIFDQRLLESGWLNTLYKNKVQIFARSCFLQGLLLENNIKSKIKKRYTKQFYEFNSWCKLNKITALEACINFVRQFNKIKFTVVGFNNTSQLKQIFNIFKKRKKRITKNFMNNDLNLIDPRRWN